MLVNLNPFACHGCQGSVEMYDLVNMTQWKHAPPRNQSCVPDPLLLFKTSSCWQQFIMSINITINLKHFFFPIRSQLINISDFESQGCLAQLFNSTVTGRKQPQTIYTWMTVVSGCNLPHPDLDCLFKNWEVWSLGVGVGVERGRAQRIFLGILLSIHNNFSVTNHLGAVMWTILVTLQSHFQ